ncbi:MAG: hypothetical protein QOI81_791 [Actinomycetota bacterium]|nr:hypothetical protein [Actinomycetota bacterium]
MTDISRWARSKVPAGMKGSLANGLEYVGAATSALRILPSFLVAGTQRSGSSSLYEYLVNHPAVGRSIVEEVHYFDWNYLRGMQWYRGHFPTAAKAAYLRFRSGAPAITGEATPYYIFHPLAPQRIAEDLPGVKLLVTLRNPVDRAYSHFSHERAMSFEELSFEDALAQEGARLEGEVEKIMNDPAYRGFNHQHFSYFARGTYADQLEHLFALFTRERVLVVTSDELSKDPGAVYARAIEFLDLPAHPLTSFPKHNTGSYSPMDETTRRRLTERYEEPNERLYRLLDVAPFWPN